jgi:phosphate transport system substrate-binding protein
MHRVIAVLLLLLAWAPAKAETVTGAGSTFAFPIIAQWADAYHAATGAQVVYQPIGSTAGQVAVQQSEVSFGVTDAPLPDSQLLRDGLSQFPVVMGAIVPAVNLPGLAPGRLHLPAQILASIYLGQITKWDDPAIVTANPGVALPNQAIHVLYRSDGSGTSFNWTNFLSQASLPWRAKFGAGTKVAWPVGSGVQGSGGMAAAVAATKGSIGYVEYSTAKGRGLTYALTDNAAGRFIPPAPGSFQAALASVDWAGTPDFAVVLTDTKAGDAYPLMATSFVLIHPTTVNRPVLDFFNWVMVNGQDQARRMDYLPLPATLVGLIQTRWASDIPAAAQPTTRVDVQADNGLKPAR